MEIKERCRRGAFLAVWAAALVFWLLLSGLGLQPALGAGKAQEPERVFDYAGIFAEGEKDLLEETITQLREEMKAEVVVLTVKEAGGRSAQEVADGFYFDQGFGEAYHENGILFLVDMDNRELYLGTYGSMIRVLTDKRIERILDKVYAAAASGQYGQAALAGISEAGEYFRKGIQSNQYIYDTETGKISRYRSIRWYEALFALAASGAVAGLVCLGVVRQHRMEEPYREGEGLAYRTDCQFRFQNPKDTLVNTLVTHVVIPRDPPQSAGGRGGGFSGRSSTHSYGGHQAGGGGRKF